MHTEAAVKEESFIALTSTITRLIQEILKTNDELYTRLQAEKKAINKYIKMSQNMLTYHQTTMTIVKERLFDLPQKKKKKLTQDSEE